MAITLTHLVKNGNRYSNPKEMYFLWIACSKVILQTDSKLKSPESFFIKHQVVYIKRDETMVVKYAVLVGKFIDGNSD